MKRSLRRFAAAGMLATAGMLTASAGYAGEHRHEHSLTSGFVTDDDDRDEFSYGIVEPGGHSFSVMSNFDDWERLNDRLRASGTPVFWFRLHGTSYAVRDREYVEHAKDITREIREIGKKQGEVGRRQGEIGRYQGRIGAQQGRVGAEQGALGARLAAISMRLSLRARRGDDTEDLEREKDRIEQRMEILSERQHEMSRHHEPYGDLQSALGEKQAALGEQQRRASHRAAVELRRLAEQSIHDGVAERIGR